MGDLVDEGRGEAEGKKIKTGAFLMKTKEEVRFAEGKAAPEGRMSCVEPLDSCRGRGGKPAWTGSDKKCFRGHPTSENRPDLGGRKKQRGQDYTKVAVFNPSTERERKSAYDKGGDSTPERALSGGGFHGEIWRKDGIRGIDRREKGIRCSQITPCSILRGGKKFNPEANDRSEGEKKVY